MRVIFAFVVAVGSFLSGSLSAQTPSALRDVKFSLDFIPLGRFAEFYVALDKGYYREEGLNVSIIPGKGSADGINSLETGISDVGFVDIPSLVAVGSVATVKVVAVIYEKAPYCVFSLDPGANISKPEQMSGLELGSSSASFIPKIHMAFMKMHGLDPAMLKIVNTDASARVALLLTRKIQAADLYVMSEPSIKKAADGVEVKCLLLADYGLDLYGSGIGATTAFIDKNPDVVRGFVRASMKGLRDALRDPKAAAGLMGKYVKALDQGVAAQEIDIVKRLAVVPDTEANGLGHFLENRMRQTVDFMNSNVDVSHGKVTANDIYRTGFLPSPPIHP